MTLKQELKKLTCLGIHEWTCDAAEGIPPRPLPQTLEGFFLYARMYCKRCGYISPLSNRRLPPLQRHRFMPRRR